MKFTVPELQILNFALQTKTNGTREPQSYSLEKQGTALSTFQKLKNCIKKEEKDGKEVENFVESEVEFTTEEKALLLEQSKREWGVFDIESYQSAKSKLE